MRQFVVMDPTLTTAAPQTSGRVAPGGRWFSGKGHPAEGGVWPTARQELLLQSALLEGDAARSAWRRWSAGVDPKRLDPSSIQLLPLAYRNLVEQGVADERLAALRPRYAITWGQNQKTFRLLAETLRRLHAAGIETLVFKGAALVPLYYRDSGTRGMSDFDVLVPVPQFRRAADALQEAGWRTTFWRPDLFDTRFVHAIAFEDDAGSSVDLHCHLLMACCQPGADDPFWEASRPLEIEGVRTRTLCATDHLIQACVHGVQWVRVPPLRWVADAVMVLRKEPDEIEWERLAELAQNLGLAIPLKATLMYVHRVFGASIPEEAMRRLAAIPVTRADRLRFGIWRQSRRGRPLALILHHYVMFSRGVRGSGVVGHIRAVPDYLRFWAHADRAWKVPFQLGLKSLRVLGNRIGLYRYWDA